MRSWMKGREEEGRAPNLRRRIVRQGISRVIILINSERINAPAHRQRGPLRHQERLP
jgi:hypothetical protein